MQKPSNKDHPEKLFFNTFALSSNLFMVKTPWIDKTNKKNNMGESGSIKLSFLTQIVNIWLNYLCQSYSKKNNLRIEE